MVGRFERNKDTVQELTDSAADRVGNIAGIITGAVRDITREIGGGITDALEMFEAAKRARSDDEVQAPAGEAAWGRAASGEAAGGEAASDGAAASDRAASGGAAGAGASEAAKPEDADPAEPREQRTGHAPATRPGERLTGGHEPAPRTGLHTDGPDQR